MDEVTSPGYPLPTPKVEEARQVGGPPIGPAVAANPKDKWVVMTGSQHMAKILVITEDGEAYYHPASASLLANPVTRLEVPPGGVTAKSQDKYVLSFESRIAVITEDGAVFAHPWDEDHEDESLSRKVGEAFPLQVPQGGVAAKPEDRWVLVERDEYAGNRRIVVITKDGRVFAHRITGNVVADPIQLQVPEDGVATKPQDKWVLIHQDCIVVVTEDGGVFAHPISPLVDGGPPNPGRNVIGPAFPVPGPPVAAKPDEDLHLLSALALGGLLVITRDGRVFLHRIYGLYGYQYASGTAWPPRFGP
jgi:hypothetical protein